MESRVPYRPIGIPIDDLNEVLSMCQSLKPLELPKNTPKHDMKQCKQRLNEYYLYARQGAEEKRREEIEKVKESFFSKILPIMEEQAKKGEKAITIHDYDVYNAGMNLDIFEAIVEEAEISWEHNSIERKYVLEYVFNEDD